MTSPWGRVLRYRGDEDLQPLLLGADVLGGVDHRPRRAAAVELGEETRTPQL